ITEAIAEQSGQKGAGGLIGAAAAAFAEARAAQAADQPQKGAAAHARCLARAPAHWPLRDEAARGNRSAPGGANDCASRAPAGKSLLPTIGGSSIPSDFAITLLGCAEGLKGDDQKALRDLGIARLEQFVAHPPEGATVDDRADAYNNLAEAEESAGDLA